MSKFKRRQMKKEKAKPKCGLCGQSSKPLTKTECCDNLICDDWSDYQMFSYAHNSCARNHDRYTMCSTHFNEGHEGGFACYAEYTNSRKVACDGNSREN